LPDGSGLDLAADAMIQANKTDVPRFVVLSSREEASWIAEAKRVNCSGYIAKSAPPHRIAAIVRAVARGERVFEIRGVASGMSAEPTLTSRELSCLALVAEGLTNREIAEVLGVTSETIKSHLSVVREKLGASDRAQAVAIGVRRGLV
jgi:DNA-binding NarL/FixJ family response regulator